MSDLLRPLLDAIETVRGRIEKASSDAGWNEAQTRASLIDPILKSLGWDTTDPEVVRHEFQALAGRADYALQHGKERLAAIIEAKALGRSLDNMKEIGQTTNYANSLGAPYAALTDGNRWVLYDVFERAPIAERKILDVSVSDGEPQAVALALLALWRPNATSGQWRKPEEPRLPNKGEIPPPPPDWVALPHVQYRKGLKPKAIRFADGTEVSVRFWRNVLARVIGWLHKRGALGGDRLPFMSVSGTKPRVLSRTRRDELKDPKDIENTPLSFEGWLSGPELITTMKRLLEACGHSADSLRVRLAE